MNSSKNKRYQLILIENYVVQHYRKHVSVINHPDIGSTLYEWSWEYCNIFKSGVPRVQVKIFLTFTSKFFAWKVISL